jgi:adenylylsulfate kinase-like enzyme
VAEDGAAGPILILAGPPGVGKTTTARLLAAGSERAVHLESDLFFHFIRAGYVEPWKAESHEQNTIVMRIVAAAAAGYADAGYFTIVDGIISPRWAVRVGLTSLPVVRSRQVGGRTPRSGVLTVPVGLVGNRGPAV